MSDSNPENINQLNRLMINEINTYKSQVSVCINRKHYDTAIRLIGQIKALEEMRPSVVRMSPSDY